MAARKAAEAVARANGTQTTQGGQTADGSANGEGVKTENGNGSAEVKDENTASQNNETANSAGGTNPSAQNTQQQQQQQVAMPRQPWEYVEEVMNVLKTAFPLLALTMEKMVDQISVRAKPSSDEDIYRFFAALLADALQVSLSIV